MRLLFERVKYTPSVLDTLDIPTDWRTDYPGGEQSVQKVGYFRASTHHSPIFILPKIFETDNKAFGTLTTDDLASLPTADVFSKHPEGKRYLEWLYRFSIAHYLSLRQYRQNHKDSVLSHKTHFQNIITNTPDDETTELECVLNILDFYRNHHDLIVFTEKQNQSQHFSKTNWAKTIRTQQPIFTNNKVPIYTQTVEKQRRPNDNDELLVILYAVLRHFKTQYGFRIDIQTSMPPIDKIDTPSVSNQLIRRLKALKLVYFADRFRKLLNLLLLYFQKTHQARTQRGGKDYLLCHDYHLVFEDMVDMLLSDQVMEKELKNQADGKIVDHLFRHQSLFAPDDIWYIGDSKYYKAETFGSLAIYKQHTYAKNIIQYHLNLFHNNTPFKERYRDDLTEGYNVSPNFFIQAFVHHDDLFKSDAEFEFDSHKAPYLNYHFENRLFDRDTLSVHHFKINFLFVLRSYITQNALQKQHFKAFATKEIRTNILAFYNEHYDFYAVPFADKTTLIAFVNTHFKDLNGKIYTTSQNTTIWLSLEKKEAYGIENNKIHELLRQTGIVYTKEKLV